MSSRPKRSPCSSTSRAHACGSATATATGWAPSSSAAACTFSGRREASVKPKPSSRSMRPIARPIPDEPPVMRAARSIYALFIRKATSTGPRTLPVEECPRGASHSPQRGRRLRPPSSYHWTVSTLTGLTAGGGCAAKYSALRLEELLRGFVPAEAESLLVGLSPADDAAVYKLDDERALVFTVDFFPPLVDDPGTFGRIAATNALNDVFAMGGVPLLALSVAAFPEELPNEVLAAVFSAADEQVRAAGALLAGGHTIRDAEPKYGLAVVGMVHPDGVWAKSTAKPGDALFLTKPVGTGLVLHAKGDITAAVELM